MKLVFFILVGMVLISCSKAPQTIVMDEEKSFVPIRKVYENANGKICLDIFQDSITFSAVSRVDSIYYRQRLSTHQKDFMAALNMKYEVGVDSICSYAESLLPFDSLKIGAINTSRCLQLKYQEPVSEIHTWNHLDFFFSGQVYYKVSLNQYKISFEAESLEPVVRNLSAEEFNHINDLLNSIVPNSFLFYQCEILPADHGIICLDGQLIYSASPLFYNSPQNKICDYLARLTAEAIPNLRELQINSAIEELNTIISADTNEVQGRVKHADRRFDLK